ncbi:esterase B1-like isoform X2 [Uranotaenia lowii]|uniref:esterase B1-like isoform X2 n=1 Tax=Uranotaenia lowii TaxID=190385 RepID=UPI0024792454|nr:esterase B1-like isoform X2 [Uranotaenia lowii]
MMRLSAQDAPSSNGINGNRTSSRVAVKVAQGFIFGSSDTLPNGGDYYCFKGIPYAKPPVGKLRFRSPVPIDKFPVSYLDCTKERSNCMGLDVVSREISGSEDGLYLNVYSPKIPVKGQGPSELFPVIVFIHGGGLIGGHADSSMYTPDFLVQDGVVVVTLNYRLGVFGFLCLPDAGIYGNAGLKDQRLALQWVNQNIRQFSGDPNNVTLFGASSGAVAAHYHCLSEESKKYFHKGIMTSGCTFIEFAHCDEPEEKARKMANLLGFNPQSDEEVIDILRKVPARDLFDLQFKVLSKREEKVERVFQIPFLPVIERKSSPDFVITKHPMEILCEPDSIRIPILTGYNNCDGMMMLIDTMKMLDLYNQEPERFIPRTLNIDYFSPEARELGKTVKQFYFNDKPVSRYTLPQIVEVFSDKYIFAYPISVEVWSRYQRKAKLFCYRFCFDGSLNKGKSLLRTTLKGATHIDEVYYVFSSPLLQTNRVPPTDPAYKMRAKMVRMWTNFAKFGDPTPSNNDELLPFKWLPTENIPPYGPTEPKLELLNIGPTIGMVSMPERKRMNFWTEIFRKYNGHIANVRIPTSSFEVNNNV